MPTYSVIRKADQVEVYRYADAQPVEWTGMEFATHDHVLVPENPTGEPEPEINPLEWRITKRSFWNRFPANNEVAMRAVMNAGSPALLAASLQRLQTRVDASPYVDLLLPETIQGVYWLASEMVPPTVVIDGVTLPFRLTPEQVAAVIGATPTESEIWYG